MIKRVSAVLRLCDSALGRVLQASEARIWLDGAAVAPIYKPGGYFVLIDLPAGPHHVSIHSAAFQPDELDILVDYSRPFDETMDVKTVMLNPGAAHPAVRSGVIIRGRFAVGRTAFYIARGQAQLKLAQDGAGEGTCKLKLFSGGKHIMLPSLFYIRDKTAKSGEFVMINASEGDEYTLGSPLRHSHRRSADLIPMVRYLSEADGSFFAMLPAGYKADAASGKIEAELLIAHGDALLSRAVSLVPKGENDMGVISL